MSYGVQFIGKYKSPFKILTQNKQDIIKRTINKTRLKININANAKRAAVTGVRD